MRTELQTVARLIAEETASAQRLAHMGSHSAHGVAIHPSAASELKRNCKISEALLEQIARLEKMSDNALAYLAGCVQGTGWISVQQAGRWLELERMADTLAQSTQMQLHGKPVHTTADRLMALAMVRFGKSFSSIVAASQNA